MIVIASLYIYSLEFTQVVVFFIPTDVMEKTANSYHDAISDFPHFKIQTILLSIYFYIRNYRNEFSANSRIFSL